MSLEKPGKPGSDPGFEKRINGREGAGFTFLFDDREVTAWPGESVAAALISQGRYGVRTAEDESHRGLLCGIGVCWECRCVIDGQPNTRACMTPAAPGMVVRTQRGLD